MVLPIRHGGVKHAAITSRSAVHVADAASDARFNRKSDAMLGLVTNSVLMVPIFESRAAAVERGIAVSGAAGGAKSDARRKLIGLIEVRAWARVRARACVCETEREKAARVFGRANDRFGLFLVVLSPWLTNLWPRRRRNTHFRGCPPYIRNRTNGDVRIGRLSPPRAAPGDVSRSLSSSTRRARETPASPRRTSNSAPCSQRTPRSSSTRQAR